MTDFWQTLYTPPPPGEPACRDASPLLFDINPSDAAAISRANSLGKPINATLAYRLEPALRYCARCPLAVREWCDRDATKPTVSGVAIIAGGRVYSRGVVVWDLGKQADRELAA
jgi:hypothetical protein